MPKMNHSEKLAYKELQKRGYLKIEKTIRFLPDFVCDETKRFEVKTVAPIKIKDHKIGLALRYTMNQFEKFLPSDIILVYKDNQLISEFEWGDRDKSGFKIYISNADTGDSIIIN